MFLYATTGRPLPSLSTRSVSASATADARPLLSAVARANVLLYISLSWKRTSSFHRNASSLFLSLSHLFCRTLPTTASFLFALCRSFPLPLPPLLRLLLSFIVLSLALNSSGFTHHTALSTLIRGHPSFRETETPHIFLHIYSCASLLLYLTWEQNWQMEKYVVEKNIWYLPILRAFRF